MGRYTIAELLFVPEFHTGSYKYTPYQGRGVHVTGVSAAYTFKLNKNILSE
jgi:hypothetical protein